MNGLPVSFQMRSDTPQYVHRSKNPRPHLAAEVHAVWGPEHSEELVRGLRSWAAENALGERSGTRRAYASFGLELAA